MGNRRGARRGWWLVALAVFVLLAGACSGGGGSSAPSGGDDLGLGAGEQVVQFDGAAKVHLGGTLTLPPKGTKSPAGGVLIVPTVNARVDRNGYLDVVPADPIYQDLSKAIGAAGLAAFRYDRRGTGVSKLDEGQTATFDDMVADAQAALSFLAQRGGVDPNGIAVVGHDLGGIIAMRLAATDSRVKSLVLLSTPGRPLVEVLADSLAQSNGQESADAFRATVATLLATGSLPPRASIAPEHQPLLPSGQDALLKTLFSLDPVAEAAKVTVPTLVVTGNQSTTVDGADAAALTAALPSSQAFSADTTATLQQIIPALPQAFDPNDHRAHGAGRPPDTATRDQAGLDHITGFLNSKVGGTRQ